MLSVSFTWIRDFKVRTECKILVLQWNRKILAAPVGSVGIFLTAVESRTCAMWCCEVTDSGFRPVTACFPWSDPLEIGLLIKRFLDTINPAPTQNLNHDIVPSDAQNPSIFLEYLYPQPTFDGVIFLNPLAKIFGRSKGHDSRWIGYRHNSRFSLASYAVNSAIFAT